MVRGDHQLSETKFGGVMKAKDVRPAHPAEIVDWFGASAGSLGPVGVKNMRVLADVALEGRKNMIAGANKDDYHLKNVTPGKDFNPNILTCAKWRKRIPVPTAAAYSILQNRLKSAIFLSSATSIRNPWACTSKAKTAKM
jgi:prolyl-tRNA synthetase